MMHKDAGHVLPSRNQADALIQQGHALEDRGQPEEALSCYQQAIILVPSYAYAYLNQGNAQLALNRVDAAISSYRNAVQLQSDYVHAHFNLGRALFQNHEHRPAIAALQHALTLQPGFPQAHVMLGCAYEEIGEIDAAEQHYQAALDIQPEYGGARINLGSLLYRCGQVDQALAEFERVVAENPSLAEAHAWLAKLYREMGCDREAIACNHHAHNLSPGNPDLHSALLFALNCAAGVRADTLLAEHIAFARQHCSRIQPQSSFPNQPDTKRRLRIGYVSGDFIGHPVSIFLEPLLQRHDRNQVEVFCYHNNPHGDVVTDRLRSKSDHWRDIARLGDAAAAALIQNDLIDILVDLSGHTNLNRLLLFAHKPAPVQATWLGYLSTTGLSAIDYRICDNYTDPPELTESLHVERLARLPHSQWCYAPIISLPPVNHLPLNTKNYITLGSFNNFAKLNEEVFQLWVRILDELPTARLWLGPVPNQQSCDYLTTRFESLGISRKRLIFRGRQIPADYFASYGEVDVALDPFPYNGGTTTFDALLMGVPVVTLAGERSIARGGVSIMSNLGLPDFIAHSHEDYVRIVRELADNPAHLTELRATLRSRMQQSPLMDTECFARDMERLYRQMWKQWVIQQQ